MRNGAYFETEPGIEIYDEVTGEGPPLILVPGWTFATEMFNHRVEHFAATRQVVSFDPRGQGRSAVALQG